MIDIVLIIIYFICIILIYLGYNKDKKAIVYEYNKLLKRIELLENKEERKMEIHYVSHDKKEVE